MALDGNGAFVTTDRPADPRCWLRRCAMSNATATCCSRTATAPSCCPQLPYWVQAVIGGLKSGALLFCDCGYPRKEYYLDQRSGDALRAFYRHRMHGDVFRWPACRT